jgi:hypothetical protein
MGELNSPGMWVTSFPRTYSSDPQDLVYLDTRGFLDVRLEPEVESAELILLEMALSKAETIRFVLVDEYQTIAGGIVKYRFVGSVLRDLTLDPQNAPILFVYNRFTCPEGVICPEHEPNRTLFIIDRIKECAGLMRVEILERMEKPVDGKDPDAGFDARTGGLHYQYAQILESNFAGGRLAYFDPTSERSIAGLQQQIRDLPPITKGQFNFSATIEARRQFDQDLGDVTGPLDAILSAHLDSIRFPDSVLDLCTTTIQMRIEVRERYLKMFESLRGDSNPDELRKGKEALRSRNQLLTEQVEQLQAGIKSMEEKTEVVFDCQWDLRDAVVRNKKGNYDGAIPYFEIDENISEGTTRIDNNIVTPAFDVTYICPDAKGFAQSGFGSPACTGRVQLIAHAAHIPATTAVLQKKRQQLQETLTRRDEVQDHLNTIMEHEHFSVTVTINDALDLHRKRAQALADAKQLREVAATQYRAHEQEIQTYGSLVSRLPSHRDEMLDQFGRHWKESKTVEAFDLDSNDDKKVSEAVDAIGDATRDRKVEFKAYRLLDRRAQTGK